MSWSTSKRKYELPRDWHKRRAACLRRDPLCTCPGCPRCTGSPCTAASTEADHIGHRMDHDAIAGKCSACHRHRTQQQANAARLPRQRPVGRHPGLL